MKSDGNEGNSTKLVYGRRWTFFLWALGIVPGISALSWPRSWILSSGETTWLERGLIANDYFIAINIGRTCTLWTILVALGTILLNFSSGGRRRGMDLMLASVSCLGLSYLFSSVLGTKQDFAIGCMAFPLLFFSVYTLPVVPREHVLKTLRRIGLLYIYGSFFLAAFIPRWVFQYDYDQGYIPGLTLRLHGLMINQGQTALMSMLVILILLHERWFQSARGRFWTFNLFAASAALFLTQSKITWALFVVLMCWVLWRRYAVRRWEGASPIVPVMLFVVAIGSLALALSGNLLADLFLDNDKAVTLTGRTIIWSEVMRLWGDNPVFGYGLGLWDRDMGLEWESRVGWIVVHSHNQYIHLLGQVGLVGLGSFLVYLGVYCARSFRYERRFEFILTSLALIHLARSLTEVWLAGVTNDGYLFLHIAALGILEMSNSGPHSAAGTIADKPQSG